MTALGMRKVEVPSARFSRLHAVVALLGLLALLAALAIVVLLLAAHQPAAAAGVLAVLGVAVFIYVSPRFYAWRYVVPGVLAALVFIVVPMGYTVAIGFTNYSSDHLLSFERATEVLLSRSNSDGAGLDFKLLEDANRYRLAFTDEAGQHYLSAAFAPGAAQRVKSEAVADEPAGTALPLKRVIALQEALKQVTAELPDGTELHQSSLRRFAASRPAYTRNADGTLTDNADGVRIQANWAAGYWQRADGKTLQPGFRASVGWHNYVRIFTEQRFLEPFLRVFAWTVSFAALNTLFTFAIGVVLAVALNWDALRGRNFYRLMLFLPYAVPAFISIPVFRGLFNENLGEINLVLDQLFGIRPGWFSDATLARCMVLLVNAWLGYPYMMILSMGLIKAIPEELYEASALAGAGPLTNFFRITLPLIARPIAPLLIASFATNFNNLTLIALLTNGAPDYLDTAVPVGATDLLASYTYRIAFQDSGQNYALACAISSIVFLMVATLAIVNLKLFKVGREQR
ncbi:MAG TPA: maltose ABC transporter permease MalF [Ideonella sp.]|uniref:maltose ABC transporter permease MalF n=1 Tax=Ideonella sp. TaxID=1929293 RepID=UPI002B971FA8|nr:maltose ABC transporter permease MalF [Ideonella sp.]HSI47375.1 maltose ABC transporter permease MalF [Ideonella sp.]